MKKVAGNFAGKNFYTWDHNYFKKGRLQINIVTGDMQRNKPNIFEKKKKAVFYRPAIRL